MNDFFYLLKRVEALEAQLRLLRLQRQQQSTLELDVYRPNSTTFASATASSSKGAVLSP
jgi:hypothetical protein